MLITGTNLLNLSDPCPSDGRQEGEKKYCMFTTCLWARPSTRPPAPGVIKFTIFVDSSLVIITILSVCLIYNVCLSEEKKVLNEIMHFHYIMTCMATLYHKNPTQWVMEFIILVDPSSIIITMHLFCQNHAQSIEEWPHRSTNTPAPGVMKFTILVDPSLVINYTLTLYGHHAPE